MYPANQYLRCARYVGAETVYINLEPVEDGNDSFDRTILGKAEEVLLGNIEEGDA